MKIQLRIFTLVALGFVGLVAISPLTEASSMTGTVSIIGTENVNINSAVVATFRFSPGHFEIKSGGVITFENLVTPDPHTISLVNPSDEPSTVDQVFSCGAPGTVCFTILSTHAPNGVNPATGQPNPPFYQFVTVPGNPSGFTMNNIPGNSVAIFPGTTVQVTISAPSGTTLHYMCAIHGWMQGTIDVK